MRNDDDFRCFTGLRQGGGARFCFYVHQTDDKREGAYDRPSHIGKLDNGLDEAVQRGWTVVDMKKDWKTI
jgi:hypothetical protein